MSKATKSIIENRLTKLQELLLMGYSRKAIVQYSANNWDIKTRQTDDYIQQVTKELSSSSLCERQEKRIFAIKQRELILAKSYVKGDYRTALMILKDIAELENLYSFSKLEESIQPQHIKISFRDPREKQGVAD